MTSTTEELRPSDAELREILAEEMNKTRTAEQTPITEAMFDNPVYAPYINAMRRIASAQPGVDVPKAGDKALDIMRRYRAGVFDPVLEKRSSIGILVEEIERLTDPIAWQLAKAPPAPASDAVVERALRGSCADVCSFATPTVPSSGCYGDCKRKLSDFAEDEIRNMRAALQAAMSGKLEDDAMVEAIRRLADAADAVGVHYFDTDTMDADVEEMQSATLAVRKLLSPSPSGGEGRS